MEVLPLLGFFLDLAFIEEIGAAGKFTSLVFGLLSAGRVLKLLHVCE